ncbi:porin family protein [Lacinutrix salivirga]
MKKSLLLFALILTSFYGFSQDALYGVRAGYNISNLDFEDEFATTVPHNHRNGFAIGFFAEYGVSKKVSIAPEIQFSAEGSKQESLRIDYIQMPILVKFKLSDKLSIGVGPQASLKGHEYEDGYKNFAFSGIGGLEFMISDEFFFDARYTYGITNVFDDEVGIEAKNANIQIGFGVKF